MGATVDRHERRRTPRAPAHGTAVLHGDHGVLYGAIEDLSLGGVLISATASAAYPLDDTLDVELRLGARRSFVAIGHPVRVQTTDNRLKIAIAFDRLPAMAEDVIGDEVEAALGAVHTRPVLIIDDDEPRRRRLATSIGALGMTPLVPRTPLEAIDLLSRARLHVAVCAVAETFADIPASALHAFLADGFPGVRTVAIGSDEAAVADRVLAIWQESSSKLVAVPPS
jgi:hypothetical protein